MHTIVLRTTSDCNLRCHYCYDAKNHFNNSKESSRASDRFLKNKDNLIGDIVKLTAEARQPLVLFHGGEPLMVPTEILDSFCTELSKYLSDVRFSIQTNGTLITNETIKMFKKHHFHVGISLDGCNEIQNSDRVYPNGASTFKTVLKKIQLLNENGITPGVVMSINKNHIGCEKQLYDFLSKTRIRCNIRPVFATLESCNKNIMTPEEFIGFYSTLFDIWLDDENGKVDTWQIKEFVDEIKRYKIAEYHIRGCECSNNCFSNFISLDVDGNVYACNRLYGIEEFFYGNIRQMNVYELKQKIDLMLHNRNNYIKERCKSCEILQECYGGCPAEAYDQFGTLNAVSNYCIIKKEIHKHVEQRLYDVKL